MDAGGLSLADNVDPRYFPGKLWRLVNNPANEAIYWDRLGEVIIIDQKLFEGQTLSPSSSPTNISTNFSTNFSTNISTNISTTGCSSRTIRTSHNAVTFKATSFCSFTRQLNLYGFRKPHQAVIYRIHPPAVHGHFRHFYHSNFKRSHPELVSTLRRLTLNNKAKLRAGQTVTCRPLNRHIENHGGRNKGGKKVTSLPSPMHQEPTHSHDPHTGTSVPPRHLTRAHGDDAPLPTGLVFPSHAEVSSSSDATHLHEDFMACANHGNPNFSTFYAQAAQYLPDSVPTFLECYQLNHVDNGLLTWLPRTHGFQAANEVIQAPPSRVVSSEKPVPVSELSSSTSFTILSNSFASTRTANPQTIIIDRSSNADGSTYSEHKESVTSVTELMPEDAMYEVTIVDAKDNEILVAKVGDFHPDLSQFTDISYRWSAPIL